MIEFWSVEDTGWSGGTSWFKTGGSQMNPLRFKSFDKALEYAIAKKSEFNQELTKWRVVHTVIEKSENKRVTTEEWREV